MEPLLGDIPFAKREELERSIPALHALRIQYIELCDACARAALSGDSFDEMEKRRQSFLRDMVKRQCEILQLNGIDPKSLEVNFACPLCRDTGVILENGVKRACSCQIKQQQQKRDEQFASYPRFSNFLVSIYEDAEQRDSALRLKAILESYTLQFPHNKKPNMLLFGNAGLGKTFFLGCLTRALHERGVRCEMIPAYDLFDSFRRQHLGEADTLHKYGAVPFLAIDDLGTEPVYRNITVEYFNKLLDLRLSSHLATVITTNLDNGSLCERYGERILSRLYDQKRFDYIGLRGKDLRKNTR